MCIGILIASEKNFASLYIKSDFGGNGSQALVSNECGILKLIGEENIGPIVNE